MAESPLPSRDASDGHAAGTSHDFASITSPNGTAKGIGSADFAAIPATGRTHCANTNRWDTRQLVTMSLMCAVGALFSFVQIPLIPVTPFLTYDPSLVPAMVSGFAYGPGPGATVGILTSILHGLITGEWVGTLMNIVAVACYVLPAAAMYQRFRVYPGAIAGLVLGVVLGCAGSIGANLTIGVAFWYGSSDAIMPLVLPALLPFNLVKTILNSALTLMVYKAVSDLITPKKKQVRRRA